MRKNPAPKSRKFSGRIARGQKRLTHFKPLSFKETNSLLHSFLKLLLFKMFGHINLEQVNRIPDLPGGKHRENSSQNHSGNGDNGSFLAPAFGNTFIFQSIVRIQLVFHGSVGNLHQGRLEINTSA